MNQVVSTKRVNVAVAGSPCTGKSTLAAMLFARLKVLGFDYDLIGEEYRRLKPEMGHPRSPFERFYLWRQQNREEERSNTVNGFITDTPLFQFYTQSIMYAAEPRDDLAVRELFRMCLEVRKRYQIVVIARDPLEIPYKEDGTRECGKEQSLKKYRMILSFIQHFYDGNVVYVSGCLEDRVSQVLDSLNLVFGESSSALK